MVQPIKLSYLPITQSRLKQDISNLEQQMKTINPNSPEHQYDKDFLRHEEQELQVMEKHDLNTNTFTVDDAKKLDQIMRKDGFTEKFGNEMQSIREEYPVECSHWGIPI